jgi:hypothetical protein
MQIDGRTRAKRHTGGAIEGQCTGLLAQQWGGKNATMACLTASGSVSCMRSAPPNTPNNNRRSVDAIGCRHNGTKASVTLGPHIRSHDAAAIARRIRQQSSRGTTKETTRSGAAAAAVRRRGGRNASGWSGRSAKERNAVQDTRKMGQVSECTTGRKNPHPNTNGARSLVSTTGRRGKVN